MPFFISKVSVPTTFISDRLDRACFPCVSSWRPNSYADVGLNGLNIKKSIVIQQNRINKERSVGHFQKTSESGWTFASTDPIPKDSCDMSDLR
mmetsp:Transcript_276/g.360  ORF Transcript_276/g.360 Transcript_276/m.360 type:complete len:93 (+) Transcript_276:124-402(+)